MIKYPDKTKQEALESYRNEGIKVACERFHVPSSTIYRWLSIEKREALLAKVAQENLDVASMDERKESNPAKSAEEPSAPRAKGVPSPDEDIPDMMTLLVAENEKLRAMNQQLRKALQAFVL